MKQIFPTGLWQSQIIFIRTSNLSTTRSLNTSHHVYNGVGRINGCVLGEKDKIGKKEHAVYYLSKKFTDCECRYSLLEKNLLHTSMGGPMTKTIHVNPYHLDDLKYGSHQVHIWETKSHQVDRPLADVVVWIWHKLCYSEGHKRECVIRIFGSNLWIEKKQTCSSRKSMKDVLYPRQWTCYGQEDTSGRILLVDYGDRLF